MKHILLAFDGSYYSDAALQYAIELAKIENSMIEGVFMEDVTAYHQYSPIFETPDLVGIADEVLEELKNTTRESIRENIDRFKASCAGNEVRCIAEHEVGVPGIDLVDQSMFADVLIIGAVTYFSSLSIRGNMQLVSELLSRAHCPVIVVPETHQPIRTIHFTYDGSASSSLAIRLFFYLFPNLLTQSEVRLISVLRKEGESVPFEDKMISYFSKYKHEFKREILYGRASEAILNYVKENPQSMVVSGAFGRGLFSELFRSSTGKKLIKANLIPIFITHE